MIMNFPPLVSPQTIIKEKKEKFKENIFGSKDDLEKIINFFVY